MSTHSPAPTTDAPQGKNIGLVAAISIGVGGMIGAGIFSILGVVASISGSAMAISFLIGGIVAFFAAYSYVQLGKTFPSVGGAVTFLVRGWGTGVATGTLNLFQYFAYVISIALYATGFAAYANTFLKIDPKIWAVAVILAFTLVNFVGSRLMGRAESVIVVIKVVILIVFIIAALVAFDPTGEARLSPAHWPPLLMMFTGAGVLFVGYEGFGLITNAGANMKNPKREIPRAIYTSIAIVVAIYVLVAIGVTMNVPLEQLKGLGDSALAVAAEPTLGKLGFTLIAIAALLSTSSAVNATLFGSANVAYQVAKNGALPPIFYRQLWGKDVEGLFITAALCILFVLVFPLSAVASMGSAGFLIVYAAVSIGHLRIRKQTGAKAWLLIVSIVLCLILFVILFTYMVMNDVSSAIALGITMAASFAIEVIWRQVKKRDFSGLMKQTEPGQTDQAAAKLTS